MPISGRPVAAKEAIGSTSPRARTVRDLSRFRVLGEDDGLVTVRCAQNLREFRKDVLKHYTADITFQLKREGEGFKIQRTE